MSMCRSEGGSRVGMLVIRSCVRHERYNSRSYSIFHHERGSRVSTWAIRSCVRACVSVCACACASLRAYLGVKDEEGRG